MGELTDAWTWLTTGSNWSGRAVRSTGSPSI